MITTDVKMACVGQNGQNKLVREVITYRQNRKGKPLKVLQLTVKEFCEVWISVDKFEVFMLNL